MARRQQIGVVGAQRRRRGDHRQLRHARRLRRHDRHQHRRRIRRRPARHANADPPQRQIALPQIAPRRPFDAHIVLATAPVEIAGCSRESAGSSPETRASAAAWAAAKSRGRHAERLAASASPCRSGPNSRAPPPAPCSARRCKSARRPAAGSAARRTPRSSAAAPPR